MHRNWSLRTHFAMITVTIVVAVTAIMGGFTADRSLDRIAWATGSALEQTAAELGNRLEGDMKARASNLAGLSRITSLMDPSVGGSVAAGLIESDPALAWFGVMDTRGTVLSASRDMLVGQDISGRPVFSEGIKGPYVGDVHDAPLLGNLVAPYGFTVSGKVRFVDVSRPIVDMSGHTVGVVAAHFGWNWAHWIAESVTRAASTRKDLQMLVAAADGTVLIGPPDMLGKPVDLPGLGAMEAESPTGFYTERAPGGPAYLVGYARRGDFGWTVIARQPFEVATAPASALRAEIFELGAFLALEFSLAGYFAAGYVSRPLRVIADAAAKMKAGEPDSRIPRVGGSVEIEILSGNLTALFDALVDRDAAILRLRRDVNRDALTKLANRGGFQKQLSALTEGAGSTSVTLLYIDLDDFKIVNDTNGHAAGDMVLRTVATRIARCLRDGDIAARLGGDEFAAILSPSCSPEEARNVASRIVEAVSRPVDVGGHEASVCCSVGIASWPADGKTVQQALEAADAALYSAKRAGKGRIMASGAPAA